MKVPPGADDFSITFVALSRVRRVVNPPARCAASQPASAFPSDGADGTPLTGARPSAGGGLPIRRRLNKPAHRRSSRPCRGLAGNGSSPHMARLLRYLAAVGLMVISVPITSPEITISTRRFCCRPLAVSLEATG